MGAEYNGKPINKVVLIDIDKICPNPAQPRRSFDEEEIDSLAISIISNGLLQPLTVRRKENCFELVSGERRLRALRLADVKEAPCIIVDINDKQTAVFALLENLQREDLNCFEEAYAMQQLLSRWGITQEELGTKLGKAQSTIANKLRLLRFDDGIRDMMLKCGISERQARSMLKIADRRLLELAIVEISERRLSAAQTEKYVNNLVNAEQRPHRTIHPIVKDVRVFMNTINNAVTLMNQSGINAVSEKHDYGDHIEYVVKIPRKEAAR